MAGGMKLGTEAATRQAGKGGQLVGSNPCTGHSTAPIRAKNSLPLAAHPPDTVASSSGLWPVQLIGMPWNFATFLQVVGAGERVVCGMLIGVSISVAEQFMCCGRKQGIS